MWGMNISAGTPVKLRKLAEAPHPAYGAVAWMHFTPVQPNQDNESLPIGYDLEGVLLDPIEVGAPIRIRRFLRNGVRADGLFVSSAVTQIGEDRLMTFNSIYKIEVTTGAGWLSDK